MDKILIQGRGAFGGIATAPAVVCPESILGMVGIDTATGLIAEKGHSQYGQDITGKVLVLPCSKGSCGWSCLFSKMDSKAGVVSVICGVPVVTDFPDDIDLFSIIQTGDIVSVNGDTGEVTVIKE